MFFNTGAIAGVGAGAVWQEFSNLPTSKSWKTVQYAPFAIDYMILGDDASDPENKIQISTDATTWSEATISQNQEFAFSAYGDGYVVAAQRSGNSSYAIYWTQNTLDWENQLIVDFGVGNGVQINDLIYDGTRFIIAAVGTPGDEPGPGVIIASADPEAAEPWPVTSLNKSVNRVGFNGATTYMAIPKTDNPTGPQGTDYVFRNQGDPITGTWEEVTLPTTLSWRQVAYGNGRWVVFAKNSNVVAISTNDGDTWTLATLPATYPNYDLARAAFGLDRFHVYLGNRVYTSSDGVTWAASDTTFSFTYVTDWDFSAGIGLATGVRSTGNHTRYLKYSEVA